MAARSTARQRMYCFINAANPRLSRASGCTVLPTAPAKMRRCRYCSSVSQECFINIAREIAKRELLLIVTPEPEEVKKQIAATVNMNNVRFLECATNDTWARDHGAITMIDTDTPSLLDFTFNGWGLKFASELDNQITKHAVEAGALKGQYIDHLDFVLEGGSIESDGMGTLLTTSECLLSPQRNGRLNQVEIEEYLKSTFHLQKVLWPVMILTATSTLWHASVLPTPSLT